MLQFCRAVSGLRVSEQNLFVTSNNLSNVNTEGYRRQQLVQREFQSIDMGSYTIGLGVDSNTVRQIKSDFLEEIYRNELASYGQYETENKVYTDIQTIIGDPTIEVVQGALENIWEAANEIATDYTGTISRSYLRESAVSFISELNNIEEQLTKMQKELDSDIKEMVRDINQYAESIADLNVQICKYEAGGTRANNLRDSRDLAIGQLSKLIDVNVESYSDTGVNIRCGNGFLVINGNTNKITTVENAAQSTFCYPAWEGTETLVKVSSGELKGLLNMRGENVSGNLLSPSNGIPKEKADIVISIDPRLSQDKIDSMKNNIDALIKKLDLHDTQYQFYVDDGTDINKVDVTELKTYVEGLASDPTADYNTVNDSARYRDYEYESGEDSNKYLMVFSKESLAATPIQAKSAAMTLNQIGMRVITVTSSDDTVKSTWKSFVEQTSGDIYDIDNLDSEEGMETIALNLSRDINSRLDETGNDDGIPNARAGLNALVNTLAKEFNAIFRQGKNQDGETNIDFFVKKPGYEDMPFQMGNIEINPIFSDLTQIPLSLSGDIGDLRISEMLVDLREENVFSNGDEYSSFEEYYSGFILDLGLRAGEVSNNYTSQEEILNEANERRLAISSVSMDEELSKMIKFQYSYTAASKLIGVIDEMLDTIVNKL